MKKFNVLKKDKLLNQKRKYLFLIFIIIAVLISSFLFLVFLGKDQQISFYQEMDQFFTQVKGNQLNYGSALMNSIFSNVFYVFLVWFLGISIIGIPFIIFLLFFKSFVFGFSIVSIIAHYGFKGVFLAIGYIFPHHLIYIVLWLLLSFYALSFSIKLFRVLFFKSSLPLGEYFIRYTKILGLVLVLSLITSLIEVYLSPSIINLFLF